MKKSSSFFIIFGILAIIFISGCTQQQPTGTQTPIKQTPAPAIEQTAVKLSTGNYIVDNKGKTLYFFTKDIKGDSKCTGSCLNIWPIFYQEKITVSSGLSSSDFGTIAREDGQKQTTFKGWPLYYFASDVNPGDIKGDGVNKIWFIARPDYTISIADKDNMKFIVDANGTTLYNFTRDMPGVSNCKAGCLKVWPVFYAENIIAPSLINASDFGVITNSEGSRQVTYKQMPLYYYINDTKRGDTNGEGLNNAWYIVAPDQAAGSTASQSPIAASSAPPAIKVTSFPPSVNGGTNITFRWEVSGGTPGVISRTAIYWGYKSGGENISDYPRVSGIHSGKTPQGFDESIKAPSGGTFYFRAIAMVDGINIYSPEYQINIIAPMGGGGGY